MKLYNEIGYCLKSVFYMNRFFRKDNWQYGYIIYNERTTFGIKWRKKIAVGYKQQIIKELAKLNFDFETIRKV